MRVIPTLNSSSMHRPRLLPRASERLRRVLFPWMRFKAAAPRRATDLGVSQDRGWTLARREAAVGALAELFAWYARRPTVRPAPANDDATPAALSPHSRRT